MRYVVAACIAMGLGCSSGLAQFQSGSVVGQIKDASQAPVPAATVSLKSRTTNVSRQTASNSSGEFNFASVPPDAYTVTVNHSGFRESSRDLQVSVDQRVETDFTIQVGNVTEEVTVKGDVAVLETSSSEIGNVRSEKQVADLPLNTRNFTQLVSLAPGVNNRGTASNSVLQGYTSGRGTNGAVINGAPPEGIVYMYDGIQSVDSDAGMVMFFPGVDIIQEFKVQTSSAPAAYGGGLGVINVNFKSGTNTLHGVAFEFLRNSALDAKNFFDSPTAPMPSVAEGWFANRGAQLRSSHHRHSGPSPMARRSRAGMLGANQGGVDVRQRDSRGARRTQELPERPGAFHGVEGRGHHTRSRGDGCDHGPERLWQDHAPELPLGT